MSTTVNQGIVVQLNEHQNGLLLEVPQDLCFTTESLMSSILRLERFAVIGSVAASLRPEKSLAIHIPMSLTGNVTTVEAERLIREIELLELPLKQTGSADDDKLDLLFIDESARCAVIDPRQRLTAQSISNWLDAQLKGQASIRWSVQTHGRYLTVRLRKLPTKAVTKDVVSEHIARNGLLIDEQELRRVLPARYAFSVRPEVNILLNEHGLPLGRAVISLRPSGVSSDAYNCEAVKAIRSVVDVEVGASHQLIVTYVGKEATLRTIDKLLSSMAAVVLQIIKAAGTHVGIDDQLKVVLSGAGDSEHLTGSTVIFRHFRALSARI